MAIVALEDRVRGSVSGRLWRGRGEKLSRPVAYDSPALALAVDFSAFLLLLLSEDPLESDFFAALAPFLYDSLR